MEKCQHIKATCDLSYNASKHIILDTKHSKLCQLSQNSVSYRMLYILQI